MDALRQAALNKVDENEEMWAYRKMAHEDLLLYIQACDHNYVVSKFHRFLAKKLQAVANGKCRRLIVNVAPRHGKTRMVAVEFPTWMFGRQPGKKVVVASYGQSLALTSSKQARARMQDENYQSIFDTRITDGDGAAEAWSTTNGCSMKSVGIGGGLTGHGADCVAAGSMVITDRGNVEIGALVANFSGVNVLSLNGRRTEFKPVVAAMSKGVRSVIKITTQESIVRVTPDHLVLCVEAGWIRASLIQPGDAVLWAHHGIRGRIIKGKYELQESDHYFADPEVVESVSPDGTAEVFDLQVEDNENFFANGICVHNCLIVDDYAKDFADAHSPTKLENTWNWFWSTAYTRLHPGAAVIIIATRWSRDDLVGRLLDPARQAEMRENGDADSHWEVVNLPAIAEENDVLGRPVGAALFPERYPVEKLKGIEASVGSYIWNALYRGNPVRRGGNYIPVGNLEVVDAAPPDLRWARYWDLATSDKASSDHTASVAVAIGPDGTLYVRDAIDGQWEWPLARARIKMTAEAEKIPTGIEAVAGFKTAFANLLEVFPKSVPLREYSVDRDKFTRALPWIALVENRKVKLVRGDWILPFVRQLEEFPNGQNDDYVDGLSGAFAMVNTVFQVPMAMANTAAREAMKTRRERSLVG